MRGDWKDQQLNQQYQRNIMQQIERERLVHPVQPDVTTPQGRISSLFRSLRRMKYVSEPVLKSPNLQTVK